MKSTNYLGLITYTNAGIVVSDYSTIRSVLVENYKAIYGSDIDLSTSSADGQWIEFQTLLLNNMLQTIKMLYGNLDPATASGEYLDILCSLTNVIRKSATNSNVYVNITGLNPNAEFSQTNRLKLLDKNGNTWTCEPFTADSTGQVTVLAICDEFGPVKAEIGWIYKTVEIMNGITITMQSDAIEGSWRETDSQLRARRDNSLSMRSSSVLEGLITSLLSVAGIVDAQIYNNDTTLTITAKDGTEILKNDIYVILRHRKNIYIADSILGSIIYEKKTPGVHTTKSSITAQNKSYNYPNRLDVTQEVNWKAAESIAPEIVITLNELPYFVSGNTQESTGIKVGQAAIEFLNNLQLSTDIKHLELQSIILFADPRYRGLNTYLVNGVTIDGTASDYVNPDTFFDYSNIEVTAVGNVTTIKLT